MFLGRDYGQSHSYSENLSAKIDTEVHTLIERGRSQAEEVLNANWTKLQKLVSVLLNKEKINGEEFKALMSDTAAYSDWTQPSSNPVRA